MFFIIQILKQNYIKGIAAVKENEKNIVDRNVPKNKD